VPENTNSVPIPKQRKAVRRNSCWSHMASVLEPEMVKRIRTGFRPVPAAYVI